MRRNVATLAAAVVVPFAVTGSSFATDIPATASGVETDGARLFALSMSVPDGSNDHEGLQARSAWDFSLVGSERPLQRPDNATMLGEELISVIGGKALLRPGNGTSANVLVLLDVTTGDKTTVCGKPSKYTCPSGYIMDAGSKWLVVESKSSSGSTRRKYYRWNPLADDPSFVRASKAQLRQIRLLRLETYDQFRLDRSKVTLWNQWKYQSSFEIYGIKGVTHYRLRLQTKAMKRPGVIQGAAVYEPGDGFNASGQPFTSSKGVCWSDKRGVHVWDVSSQRIFTNKPASIAFSHKEDVSGSSSNSWVYSKGLWGPARCASNKIVIRGGLRKDGLVAGDSPLVVLDWPGTGTTKWVKGERLNSGETLTIK